jgi:hypothetical protein
MVISQNDSLYLIWTHVDEQMYQNIPQKFANICNYFLHTPQTWGHCKRQL